MQTIEEIEVVELYEGIEQSLFTCKCVLCGINRKERVAHFPFPTDPSLREAWAKFCKIKLHAICDSYKLCQYHFRRDDFLNYQTKRVLSLKKEAIPSINIKRKKQKTYFRVRKITSTNGIQSVLTSLNEPSTLTYAQKNSEIGVLSVIPENKLDKECNSFVSEDIPNSQNDDTLYNKKTRKSLVRKKSPVNPSPRLNVLTDSVSPKNSLTCQNKKMSCASDILSTSDDQSDVGFSSIITEEITLAEKDSSLLQIQSNLTFLAETKPSSEEDPFFERVITELTSNSESDNENNLKSETGAKSYYNPKGILDIGPEHLCTPRRANRSMNSAKKVIIDQRKQIAAMKAQRRRMIFKIESLKKLVVQLKSKMKTVENDHEEKNHNIDHLRIRYKTRVINIYCFN